MERSNVALLVMTRSAPRGSGAPLSVIRRPVTSPPLLPPRTIPSRSRPDRLTVIEAVSGARSATLPVARN